MGGNIFYFNWEPQLMIWLQQLLGDLGAKIASLISAFGEEMLMVGIMGFIYWCIDKKWGLYLGINLTASVTWNPMVKNIALRPRPYIVHEGVKCLKRFLKRIHRTHHRQRIDFSVRDKPDQRPEILRQAVPASVDIQLFFQKRRMQESRLPFSVPDQDKVSGKGTAVDAGKEGFRRTTGLDTGIKAALRYFRRILRKTFLPGIDYAVRTECFRFFEAPIQKVRDMHFSAFTLRGNQREQADRSGTDHKHFVPLPDFTA